MLTFFLSYLNGDYDITSLLLVIFVLLFVSICSLPIHESAHAWMAYKLGDNTGRLKGRISLNPMAHLSLVGTLMLLVFGFGYAKPVPVNIRNFKRRKLYFALTSLAGPVSNILLSLLFLIIVRFVGVIGVFADGFIGVIEITQNFFYLSAYFNVALAVFNMIPVPPLDGSRILTMILPDKYYYKLLSIERYFVYILFGAIFIFNRIGFSPISVLTELIFDILDTIVSAPFMIINLFFWGR